MDYIAIKIGIENTRADLMAELVIGADEFYYAVSCKRDFYYGSITIKDGIHKGIEIIRRNVFEVSDKICDGFIMTNFRKH